MRPVKKKNELMQLVIPGSLYFILTIKVFAKVFAGSLDEYIATTI